MTGRYWYERCRGTIRHAMGIRQIRFPHYAPRLGRCSCRIDGAFAVLCETSSAGISYDKSPPLRPFLCPHIKLLGVAGWQYLGKPRVFHSRYLPTLLRTDARVVLNLRYTDGRFVQHNICVWCDHLRHLDRQFTCNYSHSDLWFGSDNVSISVMGSRCQLASFVHLQPHIWPLCRRLHDYSK